MCRQTVGLRQFCANREQVVTLLASTDVLCALFAKERGVKKHIKRLTTNWPASLAAALLGVAAAVGVSHEAHAEAVGEVDTVFKFIGPDDKIVVDAYDDPKVAGVTCYVSRAKTGGLKGAVGLAEDKSEASIACRQVGPITFAKPLPEQEEVFTERLSLLFKKLRVVRMVDKKRNTLVYLTYSERVLDGSPKNSVTAVPVDRVTVIPVK
jgi:CreA protein